MPFQSWRMRPRAANNLFFILNTQSFEIIFEVKVSSAAFYLCIEDFYLYKVFLSLEKQNEKKIQNKKEENTLAHSLTHIHTHRKKNIMIKQCKTSNIIMIFVSYLMIVKLMRKKRIHPYHSLIMN